MHALQLLPNHTDYGYNTKPALMTSLLLLCTLTAFRMYGQPYIVIKYITVASVNFLYHLCWSSLSYSVLSSAYQLLILSFVVY